MPVGLAQRPRLSLSLLQCLGMATRPNWIYSCTAVRVIDGDTIEAEVDLWFKVHATVTFRLKGINAPEKVTQAGKDARAFLAARVAAAKTLVVVSSKGNAHEKYGRYLCDLILDDASMSDVLVATGHAVVWDGKGVRP